MATLHDFFVSEVSDHLGSFEAALGAETPDPEQLHRSARAIRGAAQIARQEDAHRAARVLENAARALRDGSLALDAATSDRLRASVEDMRAIARGDDAAGRADALVARWDEIGIGTERPQMHQPGTQETRAFLEYAAHEVAAIASELDRSIAALTDDAMDREPLRAVLRRQRGLLGSARLDDIPVLAEALRAVEDLTSVIGKLDVPVRHEWLDVFRCARDVLAAAAPLLETGRQPDVTTALRRLRVLRHELLERHGVGEAVSTAHEGGLSQPEPQDELVLDEVVAPPSAEPVQPAESSSVAGDPAPIPAGPQTEGVDVRELQYRGERALQRAAELRPILEQMLADTRGGREALAELYDLIRLARE
jgi:chemotaxis protein histidine kinase CheA